MAISKEALCNAPGLKTLSVTNGAWQRVVGVNASSLGLGGIIQQEDEIENWHPCDYDSGRRIKDKKRSNKGKRKCHGWVKAGKNFYNDVYGVRFLVETDATTLLHQLNVPANDLPEVQVTLRITWL
jgi:hypothetical protein